MARLVHADENTTEGYQCILDAVCSQYLNEACSFMSILCLAMMGC